MFVSLKRGVIILILCSFINGRDSVNTSTTFSTSTMVETTTPKPETTTIKPITTSIVPPNPIVPIYTVHNKSDICIMVQMNVKFDIHYFDKNGTEKYQLFYLNSTTASTTPVTTSGWCKNDSQRMILSWSPERNSSWNMSMLFTLKSSNQFTLKHVSFNYTMSDKLFDSTNDTSPHHVQQNYTGIQCELGNYYQCMAMQTTQLEKSPSDPSTVFQPKTSVIISNMRAQAFRSGKEPKFDGSKCECSRDTVPNKVIPIVVGVALACMIVIALITFIVSSRRRQAGYEEI